MSPNNVFGKLADAITWFDGNTLSEQMLMVIAIFTVLIYLRLGRMMRIMKGGDLIDRFRFDQKFGSRTNLGGLGYARTTSRHRTTKFDNGPVPPRDPQHPLTVPNAQVATATPGRETSMGPKFNERKDLTSGVEKLSRYQNDFISKEPPYFKS